MYEAKLQKIMEAYEHMNEYPKRFHDSIRVKNITWDEDDVEENPELAQQIAKEREDRARMAAERAERRAQHEQNGKPQAASQRGERSERNNNASAEDENCITEPGKRTIGIAVRRRRSFTNASQLPPVLPPTNT